MKKQRPILFSTPMVQALLAGRKTQTRRIVKLKHIDPSNCGAIFPDGSGKGWIAWSPGTHATAELTAREYPGEQGFKCPYGTVGDILWVRETWGVLQPSHATPAGRPYDGSFCFRADHDDEKPKWNEGTYEFFGWKPSIFMPKSAARIWLEITNIRVERVQDISEEDAKAEGVKKNCEGDIEKCPACSKIGICQAENEWHHYTRDFDDFPAYSAQESYLSFWEKINGAESLAVNPWIWALTFKVLSITGKPETL